MEQESLTSPADIANKVRLRYAPQLGKSLEFEQVCGLANLTLRHLALKLIRYIGIGQLIIVSYSFEAHRYTVYEDKYEIQADM